MKKNAFTLFELLITIALIGIISIIAIPNILPLIKEYSLKKNTLQVEQALKEARSIALKESCKIYVDFSSATMNNDENGGIIQIYKYSDDSLLSEYTLDKNNVYMINGSTIPDNQITFNYKGQPTDNTGNPYNITEDNNRIVIGYKNYGMSPGISPGMSPGMSSLYTKTIRVIPLTGATIIE